MLKKSFFNRQQTAVTLLIRGESIDEMLASARMAEFNGADGIAIELCDLELEQRTKENYRRLMDGVHLPFMFILYRNDRWFKDDDEARQKYLLEAAEAGAEVVDVMGDLYDPSQYELTRNPEAIRKQMTLIDQIHERGAKVIMSSHMSGDFRTAEQVLEHLRQQSARGADILKIVTRANTEEELAEVIRTTMILNKELDKPFVHLCNGSCSRLHRFIGPKLGSAIAFAVNDYNKPSLLYGQPTIRSLKTVIEAIPWHVDDVQVK